MTAPRDSPIIRGKKTKPAMAGIAAVAPRGPGAGADRNADDVRTGHQLAKGQGFGEFLAIHPLSLLDHDTARPDEATGKATHADFEEGEKQRTQPDEPSGAGMWG